jgi:hypothetical protein
MTGSV